MPAPPKPRPIRFSQYWADLGRFWLELEHGTAWTVRLALAEKINEIEKEGK